MKSRLPALLGMLVAVFMLFSVADAQTAVYVRNRPLNERVNIGGQMYVPMEALLQAMRLDWFLDTSNNTLAVETGKGQGPPLTMATVNLKCATGTVPIEGRIREDALWVPLRPTAEALGFKVNYSPELNVLDVVLGREISEADQAAAAEVEAAREAKDRAIQEAWERRREQIQAERKKKEEEAAAAAAAAEGTEATEAAAAETGGGEGTFPPEMAGTPPTPAPKASPAAPATPAPEATPSPAASPAPAASPKPAPEAKLIVIRPVATPDYFTGRVAIAAVVQNNGYADATNVRAAVTLRGPDGSVWNRETLYNDRIAVDGTWNLTTSWTHNAGASMPRGIPTVTVDLDYTKK